MGLAGLQAVEGGWIVFNDLTPAGIASYDKIVGVDHLLRPYGGTPSLTNAGPRTIERLTFAQPRNHLTAGIPLGDIVQYTSTPVFGFQAGNFVTNDEFSYIVDYDDIAPFCTSPFPEYGNITNGFTNADGWPFIINAPVNKDGSPSNIPITLPRPEAIREFTWIGNKNYYEVTKVNLLFDGKSDGMASFAVRSDSTPFVFPIDPPRQVSTVTLQLAAWTPPQNQSNWGIDNLYLKVVRSPDFYAKMKPMLNIGGMMEYPRGKGGIVLCNLLFKASEDVPVNMTKKRAILAAILRNLAAPFSTRTVIVGAHLNYTPIDISKQANQFRNEQGWFGDKHFTFANLPTGDQTFNGVQYHIYDFPTSPVPNCIMLATPREAQPAPPVPNNLPIEVDGIPVHRKADALFFLQTARIDQGVTPQDIQAARRFELFRYIVHYADGQTAEIPVYQGQDVENYRVNAAQSLPGAALAWSAAYERTNTSAAAWSQQWNNPRPDAEIATVDLAYGPDTRAVPALLAITAATADSP